jgi:phthalate 4,5-dioxygenase reductase component
MRATNARREMLDAGSGAAMSSGVPSQATTLALTVQAKTKIARDIFLFTLRRDDKGALPPFTPGSHILVHTPSGLHRRYSLCNSGSERDRYEIAVKREPNGSGGSISMADGVAAGDHLLVGAPQNYFALSHAAQCHLLIAGGIGITPLIAMARHLEAESRDYRLIYCARSREDMAFHDELSQAPLARRTRIHFDGGLRERSLDFPTLLAERRVNTDVYCCGPRPLMDAVRSAARHWPPGTVHFEDFGVRDVPGATTERAFRVRLVRTGAVIDVPAGRTILEALSLHGIDAPSSCESGTCGTCRTKLIAGLADHRDYVLDDNEHATDIMICVSRALSDELTLDL